VVCDSMNDKGDNYDGNTNDIHCVRHSERGVRCRGRDARTETAEDEEDKNKK
jgi:hypothetical protein